MEERVGRFFCQGYTDDILYGAGKEDEVCGGGDLMVERERRPFIGTLSGIVVGDEGFFARGGDEVMSEVFLHKRLSVGHQDSWLFCR